MFPRLFLVIAALGAVIPSPVSPGPAASGTIRGRVDLRGGNPETAARVAVTDLTMSASHPPTDRRSVVYLDPAPRAAFDAREEPRPRLDQRSETFEPHVLPIVAGTTVDFPNQDPIFHNVFSVSPVKRFDLGKYPRGHSKQVTFRKAGLVQVFCDIHPSMACFILVLPNRAFARPKDDGSFALPKLPAGTYTVKAWHPDFGEQTRTVKVPSSGEVALDLEF